MSSIVEKWYEENSNSWNEVNNSRVNKENKPVRIKCIKDLVMDAGYTAFTKGKIYELNVNETINDNGAPHIVKDPNDESFFSEYFVVLGNKSTQPHYSNGRDYDIIDVCKDYSLNFNRGNIVKYVARAGKKDDELKDLLKAMDYLKREIEYLRNEKEVL